MAITASPAPTPSRTELSADERIAAVRAAKSDDEAFAVMALASAAPEWDQRCSLFRTELIARRRDDAARRAILDAALTTIKSACAATWPAVEPTLRRRADYLATRPKREVPRRTNLPTRQRGATAFSDWRDALSSHWAPKVIQEHPTFWEPLRDGTTNLKPVWGRRREPGYYALAFLQFTDSGFVDIEPWWRETTDEHWRQWGFSRRPSYQRVYERFVELEERAAGAFRRAAHAIIGHVNTASGGKVVFDLHIDSTEARTFARLQHDCREGDDCPYERESDGRRRSRARKTLITAEGSTESAKGIRQRLNERPVDDDHDGEPTGHKPEEKDRLYVGEVDDVDRDRDTGALRVKVGGHWYLLRDKTAGVRAYTTGRRVKRFWVGFYNTKVVSGHFGAPVAVGVFPASTPEHELYEPMVAEAIEACGGELPERVAGDRGFSVERVFAWNTSRGISTVMPWRGSGNARRADRDTHTRHGIPFCKHCGRPGRFVSFSTQNGGRLTYACQDPTCPSGGKRQTILCKTDYRLLLPLWRDTEAYMAVKEVNRHLERVHDDWRSRYGIGADSRALTPKRRGAPWQQLRCYAALIVEWLKIAYLHGYLDGQRRNYEPVEIVRADGAVRRFRAYLRRLNLRSPASLARQREARHRRTRSIRRSGGGPPPDGS